MGEWPSVVLQPSVQASMVPSRKRKRDGNPGPQQLQKKSNVDRVGTLGCNWVSVAVCKYTTLSWYLGRDSVKSEWQTAVRCCSSHRVEYRNGDQKSLRKSLGEEVLDESVIQIFKGNKWVNTTVPQPRPERPRFQLRLLREGTGRLTL